MNPLNILELLPGFKYAYTVLFKLISSTYQLQYSSIKSEKFKIVQ